MEMRNIPSGPSLLGNRNYSYDIKLGKAATISVTKGEQRGPIWKLFLPFLRSYWKLLYDVDGMTSTHDILEITDKKSGDEILMIIVGDCSTVKEEELSRIEVEVKKEKKNGLLYPSYVHHNYPRNAYYGKSLSGGVETQIRVYSNRTRTVLLVTESKKKGNEKQPYMITVAHYIMYCGCGGSGIDDIGFSVVVKIGVVNGKLDYSVDGPVEHPSSALLYMIEEVIRTEKWKPSACPHCKNLKSQRRLLLYESEDSDTALPLPRRYAGPQNTANMGRFDGDANGSIIQASKINFFKWWQ